MNLSGSLILSIVLAIPSLSLLAQQSDEQAVMDRLAADYPVRHADSSGWAPLESGHVYFVPEWTMLRPVVDARLSALMPNILFYRIDVYAVCWGPDRVPLLVMVRRDGDSVSVAYTDRTGLDVTDSAFLSRFRGVRCPSAGDQLDLVVGLAGLLTRGHEEETKVRGGRSGSCSRARVWRTGSSKTPLRWYDLEGCFDAGGCLELLRAIDLRR